MPTAYGNLKTNKITLQGHGITGDDLNMIVKDDAFTMSMGSNLLMTVSPDGVDAITGSSTYTDSVLAINRSTEIQGSLTVASNIVGKTATATLGDASLSLANTAFVAATAAAAASNLNTVVDVELAAKAPLASPALSGVPTAPTAASGTNTTQVATTAFVHSAVSDLVGGADGAYDTLKEIQDILVTDASGITSIVSSIAAKAPLASPIFTGSVTAPSVAVKDTITIGNVKLVGSDAANYNGFSVLNKEFAPITNSGIVSITQRGTGLAFNSTNFSDMSGNAGGIGTYTYFWADVRAFVNKNDPQAFQIQDLNLAQADASGNVYYNFDLAVMYPTDPSKFSGNAVYAHPNRGLEQSYLFNDGGAGDWWKTTFPSYSGTAGSATVTAGTGCGNQFIQRRGDMIITSGWEGGRPQALSAAVLSLFPGNAVLGAGSAVGGVFTTNIYPGCAQGNAYNVAAGLSASTSYISGYGMGMTLPTCFYDASCTQFVTGVVRDEGDFAENNLTLPTFSYGSTTQVAVGSSSTGVNTINSFGTYYPQVPTSQGVVTISARPGSVAIPLDTSLWYYTAGSNLVGQINNAVPLPSGSTAGTTTLVPLMNNVGFVTINRAAILADTSGPGGTNAYAAALDADASGNLKDGGSLYDYTYMAMGAKPMALGHLGVRDLLSQLRYGSTLGDNLSSYLVSKPIQHLVILGVSQNGSALRDFLYLGYNVSGMSNRAVADGYLVQLAGGSMLNLNGRFAKPNALMRTDIDHYSSSMRFPFSYATSYDPISQKVDGVLQKYNGTYASCMPKIYHADSACELFSSLASLQWTDATGVPLTLPSNVQMFYHTGSAHAFAAIYSGAVGQGVQTVDLTVPVQPLAGQAWGLSSIGSSFLQRAYYHYIFQWIQNGGTSPINGGAHAYPQPGTITATNNAVGLPVYGSSNNYYTPVKNQASLMGWKDFSSLVDASGTSLGGLPWTGAQYTSLANNVVSNFTNFEYQNANFPQVYYNLLMPRQDSSGVGMDIGGIPLPDSIVPLASARGYNTFIKGWAYNEVPATRSAGMPLGINSTYGAGDPRPTVAGLYGSASNWAAQTSNAVANCVTNNFMLPTTIWPKDYNDYQLRIANQQAKLVAKGLSA